MILKFWALTLLLWFSFQGYAATSEKTGEKLLEELDSIILDQSKYTQKRDLKIQMLKKQIDSATDEILKFSQLDNLFEEYRNYRIDSALVVAKQMVEIAKNLDDKRQHQAQMRLADVANKLGRPEKCISLLNRIPRTDDVRYNNYFYYLYHTAYLSLSEEAADVDGMYSYKKELKSYKDSSIAITKMDSEGGATNRAGLLCQQGEHRKGVELLRSYYDNLQDKEDIKLASVQYQLAEMYLAVGDTANAKLFFTKSAINDLKAAKRVYKSLQKLAMLLYVEGDTDRAYNYIMKSMFDINAGHARYRVFDIAEYLPIISATYDMQRDEYEMKKSFVTLVLGLVLVLMIVFYILLRRKKKVIATVVEQITEQNIQLQKLTENLKLSNSRLRESDDIKVEYIALLFDTCSEYIREQEDFRKKIAQKLVSKQTAEVLKIVNMQTSESDNFKQFIHRFDSIFNYLFPNFVEDFNQFLRPEERIKLKPGELLTPELRIYALIRLGITENGKIAEFLHYSLQTVYNYRQKMRNKAINKGESLSAKMRGIMNK